MNSIPAIAALLCLVVPVLGRGLARRRKRELGLFTHSAWVPVGMAILFGNLVLMGSRTGAWPMVNVRGGLQTLGLVVGLGWLLLRGKERMEAAGVILLSIVGMLIATSLVEPASDVLVPAEGLFFSLHMGLIFIGLGTFAMSFALSSLYLFQRGRLKRKQLAGIQDLPSLATLDHLNFRTQSIGFVCLTVGIAMGFFLAMQTGTGRGLAGPTFWGTVGVWVWYAVGLQSWMMGGWRGKPAALFGVVGFSALGVIVGLAVVWSGGWHSG